MYQVIERRGSGRTILFLLDNRNYLLKKRGQHICNVLQLKLFLLLTMLIDICLLFRFGLPVELRDLTTRYYAIEITDNTIRIAVYCDQYRSEYCALAYGYISSWDTKKVTNMEYLFADNTKFNVDISLWDVSSVKNMKSIFHDALAFNQPLDKWDVSSVTNMECMFRNAITFN